LHTLFVVWEVAAEEESRISFDQHIAEVEDDGGDLGHL
jgi:hypothetical protein